MESVSPVVPPHTISDSEERKAELNYPLVSEKYSANFMLEVSDI